MTTSKQEDSPSDAPDDDARAPAGGDSARTASSHPDETAGERPGAADGRSGASTTALPPEVGGRKGPEPTRYGDWETKGRCTDF